MRVERSIWHRSGVVTARFSIEWILFGRSVAHMRQSDGIECTSDWIGQSGLKLRRDAMPIYCKTEWMLLYNLNIAGSVMCVYKWKARKIKWIRRLPCKQFGLITLLTSSELAQQFWKRVCAAVSSELNARSETSLHISFLIQKILDVAWYLSLYNVHAILIRVLWCVLEREMCQDAFFDN